RSATGALARASPLTYDLLVIALEQGVGGLRGRVDDGLGHASDDVVDGREMDIETSLMDARDHDGREQTVLGAVMGEHDVTELEPLAHGITLRGGDPLQVGQDGGFAVDETADRDDAPGQKRMRSRDVDSDVD